VMLLMMMGRFPEDEEASRWSPTASSDCEMHSMPLGTSRSSQSHPQ
jgi:hypothetical protein